MFELFFYKYSLPLKNPAEKNISTKELGTPKNSKSREGLLIEFIDQKNINEAPLWIECSPLPYRKEYEKILMTQIKKLVGYFMRYKDKFFEANNMLTILEKMNSYADQKNFYREALFTSECLFIGLFKRRKESPKRLQENSAFSSQKKIKVEMNALVDVSSGSSPESLKSEILYLLDRGYHCFKLKVKNDRKNQSNLISMVRETRRLIGKEKVIRLDTNQSFSLSEAISFFGEVADCGIEYIEEPLVPPEPGLVAPFVKPTRYSIEQHIKNLEEFHKKTGMDYALDESTRTYQNIFTKAQFGLKALVLKASRLGVYRTFLLKTAAEKKGLTAVLSSPFETEVAYYPVLGLLKTVHREKNEAKDWVGYDTIRWLEGSILTKPLQKNSSYIDINMNDWLNEHDFVNKTKITMISDLEKIG